MVWGIITWFCENTSLPQRSSGKLLFRKQKAQKIISGIVDSPPLTQVGEKVHVANCLFDAGFSLHYEKHSGNATVMKSIEQG